MHEVVPRGVTSSPSARSSCPGFFRMDTKDGNAEDGDATCLNAAIMELSGGAVEASIRALAAFEYGAAGSIQSQGGGPAMWMSHIFGGPGGNPGEVCSPTFAAGDVPGGASFHVDDAEAASIANGLRSFAVAHVALVERSIHGRLLALWEALGEAVADEVTQKGTGEKRRERERSERERIVRVRRSR